MKIGKPAIGGRLPSDGRTNIQPHARFPAL